MGSQTQSGRHVDVKESGACCSTVPKYLSNLTKSGVSASRGNAGPSLTSAPICLICVVVTLQQSC